MSTLHLEVECYAGSSINDAAKDGIVLSKKLGIPIYFEFNGVRCACYPKGSSADKLVENYHESLGSDHNHKFANSR